ncbi:MAG: alpha/beta hydrolase [Colwellia sp.]|nr:alpha/beta hydrolase [Colwellia sp.]
MSETEIEEICYDIGVLSLHGLACGDDENEIVLCLHGWLDNAASFTPLMPYLSNKRIIAIDWPGHGFSSHRSQDAHYHFIDWVYDLLQLFELNNWSNIDIVAHSMGGMIASAFAAAFPERVKSLTLIDSIGFISAEADKTTSQLRQGMTSRLKNSANYLQNKSMSKTKSLHPTADSAIKARVAVSDMNYGQAKIIVKRGLVKEGQGYKWRADSRLRNVSPYRLTLSQAEQFIDDIKCPVQLIHGTKGHDMVTSGIAHFGPKFSNFVSYDLKGGHHVHMEQPQQTAERINKFINA